MAEMLIGCDSPPFNYFPPAFALQLVGVPIKQAQADHDLDQPLQQG
jgi:hypothetical protein